MNFLVILNHDGMIKEIKCSHPIYLVSSEQRYFHELIEEVEQPIFHNDILNCTNIVSFCQHAYSFIDYEKKVYLCLLKSESNITIFGYENIPQTLTEYKKIIRCFMDTMSENIVSDTKPTNDEVRYQFEKIQALNSELVNTKRLLEKSNATIHAVNKELNNRLVKDALTGLISKYQYRTEIEYLVGQNPDKFGVFTFMDIDNFKGINDTFGHQVGDDYLIEFANRLTALPVSNTIALRIAGDEFGLFTYGLSTDAESTLTDLWEKIRQNVLDKPVVLRDEILPLSISAGMAVYGKDTFEIYELIEYADFAMYKAKKSGKNRCRIFNKTDFEKKD